MRRTIPAVAGANLFVSPAFADEVCEARGGKQSLGNFMHHSLMLMRRDCRGIADREDRLECMVDANVAAMEAEQERLQSILLGKERRI